MEDSPNSLFSLFSFSSLPLLLTSSTFFHYCLVSNHFFLSFIPYFVRFRVSFAHQWISDKCKLRCKYLTTRAKLKVVCLNFDFPTWLLNSLFCWNIDFDIQEMIFFKSVFALLVRWSFNWLMLAASCAELWFSILLTWDLYLVNQGSVFRYVLARQNLCSFYLRNLTYDSCYNLIKN